jgi:hypothetical protein
MKQVLWLPIALAVVGCGQSASGGEDQPLAVRLPEQVCARVAKELATLGQGGVLLEKKGEARLEEAAWLQIPQPQRDQLLQFLAYDAACAAPQASLEQTAIVRNELGRVLAQQVVATSADPAMLLDE